ncbi:MAG: hypothetical protein QNJ20_01835 [Paracoccaceae bacterium]|nr:hypothetical protein [Paracoccaceae bacterium]
MSRPNPLFLSVILAVFVALYGGVTFLVGGLYLDTHEGDSFHLLDILTRMERGDVPHLDFMTPLGALAFWPIAALIEAGYSAGMAAILAQIGVAVVLLPFVVYAASTRMPRGVGIYFGCITLGLVLALSYGTATSGVGISMHYNRWAWAMAFVVLAIVFLPGRTARPVLDGLMVGFLVAALLLLKITYFVVLLPVAVLAFLGTSGPRAVIAAIVSGVAVALLVMVTQGLGFWLAYLADLRHVAGNEVRPFVGQTFDKIVAGPPFIGATLLGLATVLMVRRIAAPLVGLSVLILIPGFLYITYQNFGNDPAWLLFLPVFLLSLRPEPGTGGIFGVDLSRAMTVSAIAAFAIFFPSFFNIATSPLAHASFDKARFIPMLPEAHGHQDVFIRADRAYMTTAQVFKDEEPGPWAAYRERAGRAPVTEFQGITFPQCEFGAGSRAMLETIGADLTKAGLPEGSRLFAADLLSAYWFFAPVMPAPGSAPWYYGGLTGFEETDYVLIPKCGFVNGVRALVVEEMKASDYRFTIQRDNELYALFAVSR